MKHLYVFILVFMLTSCEYFNVKKTSSEAILNEELQTFNWNDVDAYPTFSSCDSMLTKQEKKQCFESHLTTQIFSFLESEGIVVTQDINDTIVLSFEVSETGVLSLSSSKIDTLTFQEIPNIKTLLNKSIDSLPKIFPAIKRGQQVKIAFELPVIINVK
ncbi:hypothetical protein [Thalassobellus suaedae]|uniref:Uncharacterized protein n=1 Tax=Thalassobellus suaedae TaxID=3074124 RepID=A0ABY9Y691_9FLAO|nr:hypothetical protein RHP51_14200 [Flavobacteriaceae bacterium HL-DH14]WNH13608.1 hypothetical protein RHP49_04980 [Flavobacteriaceae bacterium HL-DH10]